MCTTGNSCKIHTFLVTWFAHVALFPALSCYDLLDRCARSLAGLDHVIVVQRSHWSAGYMCLYIDLLVWKQCTYPHETWHCVAMVTRMCCHGNGAAQSYDQIPGRQCEPMKLSPFRVLSSRFLLMCWVHFENNEMSILTSSHSFI